MKWILIMYFVGARCMTLDHVEFNTKEACEKAKEEMSRTWAKHKKLACVEKGKVE